MKLRRNTFLCEVALAGSVWIWSLGALGHFDANALAAIPTPTVSLSPSDGAPGVPLTIVGQGFPPGETVALYVDQPSPYLYIPGTAPPGPIADGQGHFSASIKWPDNHYDTGGRIKPASSGPHQVCGDTGWPGSTQAIQVKACAPFTVLAGPSPSPSRAPTRRPIGIPLAIFGGGLVVILVLGLGAWWYLRGAGSR